jgi:hypothetical protein
MHACNPPPPPLQDGDPAKPKVKVPEGYSFEIYNRDDIERIMARGAAAHAHHAAA